MSDRERIRQRTEQQANRIEQREEYENTLRDAIQRNPEITNNELYNLLPSDISDDVKNKLVREVRGIAMGKKSSKKSKKNRKSSRKSKKSSRKSRKSSKKNRKFRK